MIVNLIKPLFKFANNGVSLEQFITNYESSGQSYEKLREEIRRDMIIQRVQRGMVGGSINITAQEIEDSLQQKKRLLNLHLNYLLDKYRWDHWKTENILIRINDGENFEDLVEDNSINKNSSQGGLMPWRKSIKCLQSLLML